MKKIILKSIDIRNFKGFYETSVEFDENKTVLYGKSGCGKSTIRDAWFWVCGIDVESPYPELNNSIIPDLETEVKCRISIDENDYSLSRKARQKWKTLDNGSTAFNGFDASNFEFDGVPMNATTYKNKISEAFGLEKYEYFTYLCDSNEFNNGLDYKKRREILFKKGNIAEKTANLCQNSDYDLIRDDLQKGLSVTEIIKALNTLDRAISAEKKANSIKIAEREQDVMQECDYGDLQAQMAQLETVYRNKQSALRKTDNSDLIVGIKQQISLYRNLIAQQELADLQEKNILTAKIMEFSNKLQSISTKITEKDEKIKDLEAKKEEVKATKFTKAVCPLCKRAIDTKKTLEEQKADFEKHKKENISAIDKEIKAIQKDTKELKVEYESVIVDKNATQNAINEFKPNEKIAEFRSKIAEQEQELEKAKIKPDNKQLEFEIVALEQQIREINAKMAQKTLMESAKERIKQLEKLNFDLAKEEQKSVLKRRSVEKYLLETVKISNETINSMFDGITWNLFDTYNADADKDIKEQCEVMLNGKLYRQCSTGEKLIADFYTILGLQKTFDVNLPIFFDEAQSSTFDRICDQQLIELETRKGSTTNIGGTRIKKTKTKGENND